MLPDWLPSYLGRRARAPKADWLVAALERVSELGLTSEASEKVASTVSPSQALGFRLLAIAKLAERDASTAIHYVPALNPRTARTAALQRVAEIAAGSDAEVVLSLAALIPYGSQHRMYVEQVVAVSGGGNARARFVGSENGEWI